MPICETIDDAIDRIENDIKTLKEYPEEAWSRRDKILTLVDALAQLGYFLRGYGGRPLERNSGDWE
jgi:hypothetical protein